MIDMVSIIALVLPLFASPFFAYLYNRTYKVGVLEVKDKFIEAKVKSVAIDNDVIIIEGKDGRVVSISYIDLGEEFHEFKERTPEQLFYRASVLGRILSSINCEVEVKTVKLSIDTKSLCEKIERELSSLRALIDAQPDNERLREREKILKKIYVRIREGEVVSGFRTYIILRASGRRVDDVKKIVETEAKELARALSISLGVKPRILEKSELKRLLESKLLLAPPLEPTLAGSIESATSIPLSPYESETLNYNGVFLGYRRGTKIPYLYDIRVYGSRHGIIVGPTGKGKTTLLATIANRLYSRNQVDMIIIDPKGDLHTKLYKGIPNYRFSTQTLVGGQVLDIALNALRESGILREYEVNADKIRKARCIGEVEDAIGVRLVYADPSVYIKDLNEVLEYRNISISMDNLTDDGRFFAITILLGLLTYNIYLEKPCSYLRRIIMVDEAWRSSEASIYYTRRLIKESRGFGIGLLFSTQSLSDIPKDITHNFGTAMVFGSSEAKYIREIHELTGLPSKELEETLPTLGVGEVLIKLPDSRTPAIVEIDPEVRVEEGRANFGFLTNQHSATSSSP